MFYYSLYSTGLALANLVCSVGGISAILGSAILEIVRSMALDFASTDVLYPEPNLDTPILAPFLKEELGCLMRAGTQTCKQLQQPNQPPPQLVLEGEVVFHGPWFVPKGNSRVSLASLNPRARHMPTWCCQQP